MNISKFATQVGHPLCDYMESIPFAKANTSKQKIHFLSGDPTAYGNHQFKMPSQGYQIVRNSISNLDNHGYTLSSGIPSARQAIIKLYNPKNPINSNNVIIQHGVNQGLLCVIMAFTNPGDQILVPQIGYPIFEKLGPSLGVKVVHYKLKPEKGYQIDLQHLATVVTDRSQFLFVINPSNPMGTIFDLNHMKEILAFCDQHQLPIVSDEVYHGQNFDQYEFYSFGDVTDDVPVLVLCGVQKFLSVPGWCTSWTVLFDKNNYISAIWRNLSTCGMIFLHSNKFVQNALPEILGKIGQFSKKPLQGTKPIHDNLVQEFNNMKGFKAIEAQGTFYMTVVVDIKEFKEIKNDVEMAERLLEEQNVALMPLSIFGGQLNGFRLLTCAKPQVYSQLIKRIKQFSERHYKSA